MHLIYTRFFHKALRDMGITTGKEPMTQLRNQGQILGPGGQRMSKSRGNVIDPDEQVRTFGADVVRAYLLFGYQWSEGGPWNTDNIQGVVRWLHRVWTLALPDPAPVSPAARSADAAWPLKPGQPVAKFSDGAGGYWRGFQRRWALGLQMHCYAAGESAK